MAAVDKFKLLEKIYGGKGDNIGKAYKIIKLKFSDRIESNNINYNYVINYRDLGRRVITLLFEYLDYAHDVYIGDRVPSELKRHLPWLTETKPKLKKDGTPGERQVLNHHANFIDYLSAYENPDLIQSLNNMLSAPAKPDSYEFIFKIIYELFTLSGNNFHINQTALNKLATKYKVSMDQIGNQGSERGLKYILLYFITEVKKAGFIKPVYGSLIKEYIDVRFRDILFCIFDQSTTCYGLRNLLGRCENVLTYTDKGYSQSSGTILQTLTFEQTGGAVKYKKTRDKNYIISENKKDKKEQIKNLLKTTQEEVEGEEGSVEEEEIPTTFENIVTTNITNGKIKEVTSAPPLSKEKVKHLLLNGTITFDIQLKGNTEFKCTYDSDKLSFIIERNGKSLTTLLRQFFMKYQSTIDSAYKNLIQKIIDGEPSILSAGDCGKLCAVINIIKPNPKDKKDKNDLLLLLSKSKFMGDYGPILLSSIIPNVQNDLKLPYFIHQTGDSSAQNQALALYYASLGEGDQIQCTIGKNDSEEKYKSKLQLLLSSDSGLIKTRENIIVTCNGLALYLSNDFRDLFVKELEQGRGKKLRSKKNKVNNLKTKNKRKHKKYSKKKQLNKKLSLKRNTQKGGFDEPHDKPDLNENITADNIIRIEETDLNIYCDNLIDLYRRAVQKHPKIMSRLGNRKTILAMLREQDKQRIELGAGTDFAVGPAEAAKRSVKRRKAGAAAASAAEPESGEEGAQSEGNIEVGAKIESEEASASETESEEASASETESEEASGAGEGEAPSRAPPRRVAGTKRRAEDP